MFSHSLAASLLAAVVLHNAAFAGELQDSLTITQLAALIGASELPVHVASFPDLNEDDKLCTGIDVLCGDARLLVGESKIDITLHLFLRDGVVGAVKAEQWSASHGRTIDPQALYDAALAELLESAVKPESADGLSASSANWSFGETGRVVSSRGYKSQGLVFYAASGEMYPSYMEFWKNWNTALEQGGTFWL